MGVPGLIILGEASQPVDQLSAIHLDKQYLLINLQGSPAGTEGRCHASGSCHFLNSIALTCICSRKTPACGCGMKMDTAIEVIRNIFVTEDYTFEYVYINGFINFPQNNKLLVHSMQIYYSIHCKWDLVRMLKGSHQGLIMLPHYSIPESQ